MGKWDKDERERAKKNQPTKMSVCVHEPKWMSNHERAHKNGASENVNERQTHAAKKNV